MCSHSEAPAKPLHGNTVVGPPPVADPPEESPPPVPPTLPATPFDPPEELPPELEPPVTSAEPPLPADPAEDGVVAPEAPHPITKTQTIPQCARMTSFP